MENSGSVKRIMARQKATAIRQLKDNEINAVNGGASFVPTAPGADMEIFPGIFGEPWPGPGQNDGEVQTLGYNEY